MINVGVIGFGYWGPNIIRNLIMIKETSVRAIWDRDPDALKRVQEQYPHITLAKSEKELIEAKDIDAVAIITPVSTHYPFAKKALLAGKHVFIEKPFTQTTQEAQELIDIAQKNKCIIMVDHTFIFTGAVQKIKELIDHDELGRLYYYDSTRVSLGLIQDDVNVIWDLAPHDFSIMDYVIKNKPLAICAQGADHLGSGRENMAYITVYSEDSFIAHISANWLSPVKIRTAIIGGEKKMLLWDDLEADEKIKIYDKGITIDNQEGLYRLLVDYRSGDMRSPRLDRTEALKRELIYFAQCIAKNETPINDGQAGLRVVRMLELADQSLKNNGQLLDI
ncbi:MAG: Gfo/Idh/MocA family oxidoreductase [Candidatus Omnitrophota bacterium]